MTCWGHSLSLINVQAGVALELMDRKPEQARTALSAIKQASKEALVEVQSVWLRPSMSFGGRIPVGTYTSTEAHPPSQITVRSAMP